jgi:hypothetical protein
MTTTIHHEWCDSMADWAMHNALEAERKAVNASEYSTADRYELIDVHGYVGATAERAAEAAWEVYAPEEVHGWSEVLPDGYESADAEVGRFLLKFLAWIFVACFCAWLIAGGGHA